MGDIEIDTFKPPIFCGLLECIYMSSVRREGLLSCYHPDYKLRGAPLTEPKALHSKLYFLKNLLNTMVQRKSLAILMLRKMKRACFSSNMP